MKNRPDDWILAGLESGDPNRIDQSLKVLYHQYHPIIAHFIEKNNGSSDEARDIFQDAIIVFYEKIRLRQLRLNCSIQTYLYSICKNLWLNQLRVKKRIVRIEEDMEEIPVEQESFSVLESTERNKILENLIEQLGVECKKVMQLYYFERMRMAAIAQHLGLATEQGAKNKKARCMKKLRNLIESSTKWQHLLK